MEDVAFGEPVILLQVPGREDLAVQDEVLKVGDVLGQRGDDRVTEFVTLRRPGLGTVLQVVGGVLDKDGHDVLAGRGHAGVAERGDDHVQERAL